MASLRETRGEITITTLLSERGALVLSSFTSIKKGSVWKADGLALGLALRTDTSTPPAACLSRLDLVSWTSRYIIVWQITHELLVQRSKWLFALISG